MRSPISSHELGTTEFGPEDNDIIYDWLPGTEFHQLTDRATGSVIQQPTTASYTSIHAGAGNDRVSIRQVHFLTNNANLYAFGEAGNDTLEQASGSEINGGDGDDSLQGSDADDYLNDDVGNNTLNGMGGNDTLWGGGGNDVLLGGDGDDELRGNEGTNRLEGGDGNDDLRVSDSENDQVWSNTLLGQAGHDTLRGASGNDFLSGGDGQDELSGGAGNDTLLGGANPDRLFGDFGNDWLDGGDARDELLDDEGNDTLLGGRGNDYLIDWSGDNSLDGGAGNDMLAGSEGRDTLKGGDGRDLLFGDSPTDRIDGGPGENEIRPTDEYDALHGVWWPAADEDVDWEAELTTITLATAADWDDGGLTVLDDYGTIRLLRTATGEELDSVNAIPGMDRLVIQGRDRTNDVLTVDLNGNLPMLVFNGGRDDSDQLRFVRSPGSMTYLPKPAQSGEVWFWWMNFDVVPSLKYSDVERVVDVDWSGDKSIEFGDQANQIVFQQEVLGGPWLLTESVTGAVIELHPSNWLTLLTNGGSDHVVVQQASPIEVALDSLDIWFGDGPWIRIDSGPGNDTLLSDARHTELWGGTGDDSLTGSEYQDDLEGNEGNDTLVGLGGDDLFYGGEGNDLILGGDGHDLLVDDSTGDDTLRGQGGHDILRDNDGNDLLDGGGDSDWLVSGEGHDVFLYRDDELSGDNESDFDAEFDVRRVVTIPLPSLNRVKAARRNTPVVPSDTESAIPVSLPWETFAENAPSQTPLISTSLPIVAEIELTDVAKQPGGGGSAVSSDHAEIPDESDDADVVSEGGSLAEFTEIDRLLAAAELFDGLD